MKKTVSVPASERRPTSLRMVRRASTEKTGAPVMSSRTPEAGGAAASKAACSRASARSCASVSAPGAAVRAASRARLPSPLAHTPSLLLGRGPPAI